MSPILPLDPGLINQLQVGLVNQPGGAERVARPLALQLPVGDAPQFPIDEREESVHRIGGTLTDQEEKVGNRLASVVGRLVGGCHSVICRARAAARTRCRN